MGLALKFSSHASAEYRGWMVLLSLRSVEPEVFACSLLRYPAPPVVITPRATRLYTESWEGHPSLAPPCRAVSGRWRLIPYLRTQAHATKMSYRSGLCHLLGSGALPAPECPILQNILKTSHTPSLSVSLLHLCHQELSTPSTKTGMASCSKTAESPQCTSC